MKRWFYVTLVLITGFLLFSTQAGADRPCTSVGDSICVEAADAIEASQWTFEMCLAAVDLVCTQASDGRPMPSVDELSAAHAFFIERIYPQILNSDQIDPDQRDSDDQADPGRQDYGTRDGNR